jgi:hypothetical protein
MRAVIARELIVASRTMAVPLSAWFIATSLVAFVGIWSPGVPVLAPMSLYEQARAMQWLVLALVLPWIAVRASSRERTQTAVLMMATTSLPPAAFVMATVVARAALLQLVSLAAMPALVVAQQMSAAPEMVLLADLLPLLGLVSMVAVSSSASVLMASSTAGQWLLSTGFVWTVLFAATTLAADATGVGVVCWMAAGAGAVALYAASGRTLLYLGDAQTA